MAVPDQILRHYCRVEQSRERIHTPCRTLLAQSYSANYPVASSRIQDVLWKCIQLALVPRRRVGSRKVDATLRVCGDYPTDTERRYGVGKLANNLTRRLKSFDTTLVRFDLQYRQLHIPPCQLGRLLCATCARNTPRLRATHLLHHPDKYLRN